VPSGVVGEGGVEVARDEPEIGGRELPLARVAIGIAEDRQLLEVGDLADVHLRRQMSADRLLERLSGLEVAAREGPGAFVRLLAAFPEQDLQVAVAHLEYDREHDLRGTRALARFRLAVANCGRLRHEF
jgi:hypothetical protein